MTTVADVDNADGSCERKQQKQKLQSSRKYNQTNELKDTEVLSRLISPWAHQKRFPPPIRIQKY